MFGIIIAATGGRGIFIYDRGGDNIEFYRYFLEKNVDFIVRLKSRYVFSWKRKVTCEELAKQCPTRYSDVITFDSHGKEVRSGFGKDDVDSRQSKGASIFASRINSHDFLKNSFSTY